MQGTLEITEITDPKELGETLTLAALAGCQIFAGPTELGGCKGDIIDRDGTVESFEYLVRGNSP